jgi:hypothetical protein
VRSSTRALETTAGADLALRVLNAALRTEVMRKK